MSKNPWGEDDRDAPMSQPSAGSPSASKDSKEWRLIEKMVGSLHVEQRRARRWGIFFKLLTFTYLFALIGLFFYAREPEVQLATADDHVALVRIEGPIADGEDASADAIIGALRRAFENSHSRAVILRINSPGGSPVQAGYVYDEIDRLQARYPEKKVYAVITDIGASGAYYIAAAADEIYADKASLVGSIGVVSAGFGFVDLMDKLGVERRMMTAGEHKGLLDPFQPLKDSERAFWLDVLDTTHQQFIEQVRKGRGDRLHENEQLFSGLVWTGEQALELGLIDGLGSASHVARDVVGVDTLVDYGEKLNPIEQLIDRLGVSMAAQLARETGLNAAPVQLR